MSWSLAAIGILGRAHNAPQHPIDWLLEQTAFSGLATLLYVHANLKCDFDDLVFQRNSARSIDTFSNKKQHVQ